MRENGKRDQRTDTDAYGLIVAHRQEEEQRHLPSVRLNLCQRTVGDDVALLPAGARR